MKSAADQAWEFVRKMEEDSWTVEDWRDFYEGIGFAFYKIARRHQEGAKGANAGKAGEKEKPKTTEKDAEKLPLSDTGLTPEEENALQRLGESFNAFLLILRDVPPGTMDDDLNDFRKAIHDAQRIVLSLPTLRNRKTEAEQNGTN